MSDRKRLSLFEGYGVELEYMIVRRDTLDVLPVTDEVIKSVAGEYVSDVARGDIGWSNELVLHVIELKTEGPAATLEGLAEKFQENVEAVNALLLPLGGQLMPTAAHPWMDPHKETKLWPHEYNAVYESYNRIFDCRGHGWSNLQSVHINLPFADDEEFGKLHAAIRLVLPLLPAIAASSPVVDGKPTGFRDTRLEFYRKNQAKVPSIIGPIVPEPVYTQADYEREILQKTYRDIEAYDPEGILQDEFLNSRGAIARFSRGAIEIRLLDIQECPAADLAIVDAVVKIVRALVNEEFSPYEKQKVISSEKLREVLLDCIADGEAAYIRDKALLTAFGIPDETVMTARELWMNLLDAVEIDWRAPNHPLGTIMFRGTLSSRILRCLEDDVSSERLKAIYGDLCGCLAEGRMFLG